MSTYRNAGPYRRREPYRIEGWRRPVLAGAYRSSRPYRNSSPYRCPQVDAATWRVDEDSQRILLACLQAYFDGRAHPETGIAGEFPKAVITFDVSMVPQPAGNPLVTLVTEAGEEQRSLDGVGTRVNTRMGWLAIVRCAGGGKPAANAIYTTRQVADLLHSVVRIPGAMRSAERFGIHEFTATPPRLLATQDYASAYALSLRARWDRWLPHSEANPQGVMPGDALAGQMNQADDVAWRSWLAWWFDGASHSVGFETIAFPLAQVSVGIPQITQPMAGVDAEITVRCESRGASARQWLGDGVHYTDERVAILAVRASQPDFRRAAAMARQVADRLHLLLADRGACWALERSGVSDVQAEKPLAIADEMWRVREIRVRYRRRSVLPSLPVTA